MDNLLDKINKTLRLSNYSPRTSKAYLLYIKQYIAFCKKTNAKNRKEAVESFILDKQERGQSSQTINLALNAVKFLYLKVFKDPNKIDLKFAKRSKKLPIVLSREEIKQIM